jgi:hypothetical protein
MKRAVGSATLSLAFGLVLSLAVTARAESETSSDVNADAVTMKIEDVKAPNRKEPKGQDVDTIITNKKLRAETGSKSRYSISTSFGYSGGTLNQPFGETRPNITGAAGTTDFPSLGGSVSGKYAFTTQSAVLGGVGMRWVAPLAGTKTPEGYHGSRVDADNPYIVYQYLYNWFGLQSSVSLQETFITATDLQRKGFVTSWGLGQNSVYEIGDTGISVGFNTFVGLAYFNDNRFRSEQSDYSFAWSPAIEYRLSDRLNVRLDSGLINYQHIRSEGSPWTFRRLDITQNLSLGYSVTRDIYVSPGVSFVLGNLRADRTTWSVGANINLF